MASDYSIEDIRKLAEENLSVFAHLVNPHRMYGSVHKQWFDWSTRPTKLDSQLTLLPRDHQKSHMAAVKAAWDITREPDTTILYVSATASLAEKQLFAIKQILTSDIYRRYWPEMVHPEEGKRALWNVSSISVDHPTRKKEGVRDATVAAVGLTANITGLHCNKIYLDDIVVPKNAYTEEGRETVRKLYSQLASVETTGATETVVGTRYHPNDIYSDMMEMKTPVFDGNMEIVSEDSIYEVFEKVVEVNGDFLWPKEARADGKVFGFDWRELAKKKAKYLDKTQFFAQYYNDPNDPESHRLDTSRFQYFHPEYLVNHKQVWYYKDKKLRIYAAADLAYTVKESSDYTAIVVVGIDEEGYIYVVDATRFKTDKYDRYYETIIELHKKWRFTKLLVETNAGGNLVAGYLRDQVRSNGEALIIDQKPSTKKEGSKEERIASVLEPRYENLTIFHFKGGIINILEEELILSRPKNDDLKDALAAAVSIAKPPAKTDYGYNTGETKIVTHSRFGGIVR